MRFTSMVPAMAGLIGASHATILPVLDTVVDTVGDLTGGLTDGLTGGLKGDVDLAPAIFDCAASWEDKTLFKGVAGIDASTDAAINLDLHIREVQIEGKVDLKALEDFTTEQIIRLDLAGLKAYIAVDISADAAVYETVELIASPHLEIDAGLLELALGAAFSLDLVVGVGAAVDLSAGVYLSFQEGDYIDISVLTKQIYSSKLDNVLAKALPIGVGANVDLSTAIEVQLGLRLRSHVVISAGLELLGLDIIDAGAEIAIWVDLMTHVFTLVETDDCVLSVDGEFVLNAGVAVDIGVEVLDILDLSLAPKVFVKLGGALSANVCLGDRGDYLPGGGPSDGDESAPTPSTTAAPTTSGAANSTITATDGLITSTISNTVTYTITSCHVSVPNCPADQTQVIVTEVVEATTTVCPADSTAAPAPTTTSPIKKPITITETLTTIVPCEPTSSTLEPTKPATPIVPTLTLTGTVTAPCTTETASEGPSSVVPSASTSGEHKPTSEPIPEPEPSAPVEEPTTPVVPQPPVPTSHIPVVPTWSVPANSTWTSLTPPGSTWVPPPTEPTQPPVVPTPPPTAGAGALKVGIAMAMPVVAALLL
jgi:hypothetical protein